ncbi:MAG: extracellular solute-binding protein [Spirochaetes bacterium]|nr:extracellular solute-binding protein [Spirochaetota bacterium]
MAPSALFINHRFGYGTDRFSGAFAVLFARAHPHLRVRCRVYSDVDTPFFVRHELGPQGTDIALFNAMNDIQARALGEEGKLLALDGLLGEDLLSRLDPLGLSRFTSGGRLFALPKNNAFGLLFCRRDLLDPLGVDVPQTWEALVDIGRVLQQAKRASAPILMRGIGNHAKTFLEYLWSNGGRVYAPDSGIAVNSTAAGETLDFLLSLIYRHRLVPVESLQRESWKNRQPFLVGQSAFYQESSDFLMLLRHQWKTGVDRKLKLALAPRGPSGRLQGSYIEGSCFVVPARTRFPKEAEALVKFFADWRTCGALESRWVFPFPRFKLPYEVIKDSYFVQVHRGLALLSGRQEVPEDGAMDPAAMAVLERHVTRCLLRVQGVEKTLGALAEE